MIKINLALQAFGRSCLVKLLSYVGKPLPQGVGLGSQGHALSLQLREIQNIVDQCQQVLR